MTFQLQLLDSFRATIHGKPVQFRTDKIRALLAYLVLQEGAPQNKAKLATLLWGNKDDKSARTNLRVSLSRLKKTIDKQAPSPLSDKIIHSDYKTLRIALDNPAVPVWVDVLVIQKLLDTCDNHNHQQIEHCAPCLIRLAQAVDLYKGDFLPGITPDDADEFYEWVVIIRENLHQRIVIALDALVTGLTIQQKLEEVLEYGQRLLEIEPWHEKTHQHLMLLLAMDGQRGAAINQYERCREILWEEMGLEPSPETVALYEKIVNQQPIAPPTRASYGRATNQTAEHHIPRHNLPRQLTTFFGRQTEQKRLIQLILNPDYRFVTITGEGGIGKSRLILEVAHQLLLSFEDGIWFVPLAGIESDGEDSTAEENIAAAIAQALNLSLGGQGSYKDQLIQLVQGRHLLLLLDNFEHLLEGANLVYDLLQKTSTVSVLCTSRMPLGFMAEYVVPIQQLPLPEPETAAPLTNFSSIELFVDRAKRVTGAFALEDHSADTITLCRQVAGIPLGLELAAAMLRKQTLPETIDLIQQSLDVIQTNMRDIPARHASMRAVFESSWLLLTAAERILVAQLAVFRGGFDFAAAAAVVDADQAQLDTLYEKSFLTRTPEGRYTMHELLRQFAAEKRAEMGEDAPIEDAHGRYYLQFLEEREQAIAGAKPQDEVASISADYSNVEQAWLRAVEQRWAEPLQAAAQTLADYLQMRGRYRDGVRLFNQAAEALSQIQNPSHSVERAIAHLHVHEAAVLVRLSRYDEAFQLAQTVLEEGDTVSDAWAQGYAHLHLTECLWRRGNYDDAIYQAQAIIKYAREANALRLEGAGYYHSSIARNYLGDYELAKAQAMRAVHFFQQADNNRLSSYALNTFGLILMRQEKFAEAQSVFDRVLQLANTIDDWQLKINILNNLGIISTELQDYESAQHHLEKVLNYSQHVGNKMMEGQAFLNLGWNAAERNQLLEAHVFLDKSLEIKRALKDIQGIALTLKSLGDVSLKGSKLHEAEEYYSRATNLGKNAKNKQVLKEIAKSLEQLAHKRKMLD